MATKILVTGDVVLDVNLYAGGRLTPESDARGTHIQKAVGGAAITWSLLQNLAGRKPDPRLDAELRKEDLVFAIDQPTVKGLDVWPDGFHSSALWEVKDKQWHLANPPLGYGPSSASLPYPAKPIPELNAIIPRIVVIDDGMLGFRKRIAEGCWPAFINSGPESCPEVQWIVLKMSSPLCHGDLWHALSEKWKGKLILIVSAADLRRADVRLTQGLSWDQTAEDILDEIDKSNPLRALCECRHQVITLASDGAVWLSNPGDPAARRGQLVFDCKRAEGEFDQETGRPAPYGSLSAMTASIVWRLWYDGKEPDLIPALKAGLSAARVLRERGHGPAGQGPATGFPFTDVARELCTPVITRAEENGKPIGDVTSMIRPQHAYACVELPSPGTTAAAAWTILKANTEGVVIGKFWPKGKAFPPLTGAARRLALFGPQSLSGVPNARFGDLLTMDRGDIEALRSIRQLMLRYEMEKKPKAPLSIAVFGAPGSGKSFGLKQIAGSVFGEKALIEFNLSQFKGPEELYGAYHQVRDKRLAGVTPVVFWDEFDSRDLMWLQYLLAPMQDGLFQEGQLTHSIGKCVFVFAGGTSFDYRHFGPAETADAENEHQRKTRREFVMKKGPDFKSRLTMCLNVLGPNRRKLFDEKKAANGDDPWYDDITDIEYPVRRAILLRCLLKCGGKDDETKRLAIDQGLLTALLEVGHYRNGARSMEKLVAQIVAEGGPTPSRAALPHREIMEFLVLEVDDFYGRLYTTGFGADVEILAQKIHERYLWQLKGKPVPNPESAKEWKDLSPDLRASNRAAAGRIAEILAVAGLSCEPGTASASELEASGQVLQANLDMLAEMEHDGWMDEKRRQGWTFGETRDNDRLKHPLMIPYGDLPEAEKKKDRDSILEYVNRVAEAGYKIVFKNVAPGPSALAISA